MRIARQTPTELMVRTGQDMFLRLVGITLLVVGLLLLILLKVQPLDQRELQDPSLLVQQQAGQTDRDRNFQEPSVPETGFRLARYVGHLLLAQERPVLGLALVGLLAGLVSLVGPFGSRVVTFDRANRQVTLRQPRWFFQSRSEIYSFDDIEIRVERDRVTGPTRSSNYGVQLVISHSEGVPLSKNYIYYKTVFPLSESFRYDYPSASRTVERIQTFMTGVQPDAA